MDLLFVMDPLPLVNPDKDTSFDLMVAAAARKHRVFWCEQTGLRVQEGKVVADAIEVEPIRGTPHYREKDRRVGMPLTHVFMRKDPPVDALFMHTCQLLALSGARVYNRPESLLTLNEKLYALQFPQWIPASIVTASLAEARAFARHHARVVLKPLDGNGGKAVFVARETDSNFAPLMETLTADGKRFCIVQEFLPAVAAGDKRIILVNGEPVGALNRIPAAGEHRANLHSGGSANQTELSTDEQALCAALKPSLLANGLLLVGIDVIGGRLTEINVTSPTGVQEVRALSGIDVSPRVIAHVENNT